MLQLFAYRNVILNYTETIYLYKIHPSGVENQAVPRRNSHLVMYTASGGVLSSSKDTTHARNIEHELTR